MKQAIFYSLPVSLLLILVTLTGPCEAKAEVTVPVSDVGEGAMCDQNQKIANTCLTCTSLPFDTKITLVACCSEDEAMKFCDACVNDVTSCSKVMHEIKQMEEFSEEDFAQDDDYYDDSEEDGGDNYADLTDILTPPMSDKRFGSVLLTSPTRETEGLALDINAREKRYGKLYLGKGGAFGKRNGMEKRYGVLGMGSSGSSWYGKRSNDKYKRYGTLYMGSGSGFGKRTDGGVELAQNKRFGSLGVGWKPTVWNKRGHFSDDAADIDKRFGRLFVSPKGLFGKRDVEFYSPDDAEEFRDSLPLVGGFDDDAGVDKRYGHVFLGGGGYFGKRADMDVDKRFGRLFMNRRKGSIFG